MGQKGRKKNVKGQRNGLNRDRRRIMKRKKNVTN